MAPRASSSKSKASSSSSGDGLSDHERHFYDTIAKRPQGVTSLELGTVFSSFQGAERLDLINRLMRKHLLNAERFQGGLRWTAVDKNEALVIGSLSSDERMVFAVIRDASNEGMWSRHVKDKTGLHTTVVTKVLKSLENQRIVKTVKSVKFPTRKIYMLASIQPSSELSGGPWYSDTELDVEFITTLSKVCEGFIASRTFPQPSEEGGQLYPAGWLEKRLPTAEEIHQQIKSSRVINTQLGVEHVIQILDTLVYDGKVERFPSLVARGGADDSGSESESESESESDSDSDSDSGSDSGSETASGSSSDSDSTSKKRKRSSSKSSRSRSRSRSHSQSRSKSRRSNSKRHKSSRSRSRSKRRDSRDESDSDSGSDSGSDSSGTDSGPESDSDRDRHSRSRSSSRSQRSKKSKAKSKKNKSKKSSKKRSRSVESDHEAKEEEVAAAVPTGSDMFVYRSLRRWRGTGSYAGYQDGTGYALAYSLGLGLDEDVVDEMEREVKASLPQPDTTSLAVSQIPCGSSTNAEFCTKGGATTSEECPHFPAWLEAGWKERISRISKAKATVRERMMPVKEEAPEEPEENFDEGVDVEMDGAGEDYEEQQDAGYD